MGRKDKHSSELKLSLVKRYLAGEGSSISLAREIGTNKSMVLRWVKSYSYHGENAFKVNPKNRSYTIGFKEKIIEEYLSEGSMENICAKYQINSSMLSLWVKLYNEDKLKDYSPAPEVYKMKGRKTTYEERKEIVQYCLSNNNNYKETAKHYDLPYSRVYSMVNAYIKDGDKALMSAKQRREYEDSMQPLTKEQKLQKKIETLEAELELERIKNQLLLKKNAFAKERLQEFKTKTRTKR